MIRDEAGLVGAEEAVGLGLGAVAAGQAGLSTGDALEVLDATLEEEDALLAGGHGEREEDSAHISSSDKCQNGPLS